MQIKAARYENYVQVLLRLQVSEVSWVVVLLQQI